MNGAAKSASAVLRFAIQATSALKEAMNSDNAMISSVRIPKACQMGIGAYCHSTVPTHGMLSE